MIVTKPEPYLAGMFAEIRCSIIINDAVDTPVDVEVVWFKDGVALSESVRVRTLPTQWMGISQCHSLLQFSTLSSSTDSGFYTCKSSVYPTENINYILNGTAEASLPLLGLTGIYCTSTIGSLWV